MFYLNLIITIKQESVYSTHHFIRFEIKTDVCISTWLQNKYSLYFNLTTNIYILMGDERDHWELSAV
jgi:hypothetical protein